MRFMDMTDTPSLGVLTLTAPEGWPKCGGRLAYTPCGKCGEPSKTANNASASAFGRRRGPNATLLWLRDVLQ